MHEEELNDESWGVYDGQCRACDEYGRVDATLLCEFCAEQIERDLIRLQDWEYTVSGYALPPEAREKLRKQVIKQYGKALELIADPNPPRRKRRHRRKNKKKKT
jgi:hypothetical protein